MPSPFQDTVDQGAGTPGTGHVTVLLEEAVVALSPMLSGVYVDGTFGGGGHTERLLAFQPAVSRVIAIDADPDAGPRAARIAAAPGNEDRLVFVHQNFRHLAAILARLGIDRVDGVLLDLGLSSYQLDEGERGFSFRADAPLDMRFDPGRGISAADVVNTYGDAELAHVLWNYGEERQSRRIAAAIVRARQRAPIHSAMELAVVVESAVGGRRGAPIHPATRTFQALRIHVNHELEALTEVLPAAVDALAPGGRLVVISFHSLEDRIVKRFMEAESRTCVCPPDQPVCTCETIPRLLRVGRAVRPGEPEIKRNPRSRSAIMRVAERLDGEGAGARQGSRR